MNEDKKYDGIMLYNIPILVDNNPDGNTGILTVLGLLYSTSDRNPLWCLILEMYSCYLLSIEKLSAEGGKVINEDTWMTGDGKIIKGISSLKSQWNMYRQMKPSLQYKLYEFSDPLEYNGDEVKNEMILKPSLLDRCGVSFIENLDIKNKI